MTEFANYALSFTFSPPKPCMNLAIYLQYIPSFFIDKINISSSWEMEIMKFFMIQWPPITCELPLHRHAFLSRFFTTASILPLVSETKFCTHFKLQAKLQFCIN